MKDSEIDERISQLFVWKISKYDNPNIEDGHHGLCKRFEAFSITFNPLISDAWVYFKREIQQEDK